jgi:signal transduction histidine kinase
MSAEDRLLAWLDRLVTRVSALTARVPLLVDCGLVAALLAISFIGLHHQDRLGPQTIVFGLVMTLPLLLHRTYPVSTFATVALVAFVQWLINPPQLADAAVLISLYWVARDARIIVVIAAAITVEAGAVMAVLKWTVVEQLKVFVGLSGLAVASAVLGITVRQRQALLQSLHLRAAQLELERDQQGQIAASAERARIAREMHDIVSHNLTVMIALSDAAEYTMSQTPERALPAIRRISSTGREALHEMRRLLGVLRDEPSSSPLEPQPSLARLDDLVARVEAAGIPVQIELHGDPDALSEGVQLAVFRVTQEALTNTLKHAVEPRRASIRLRCGGNGLDGIELEVSDDGQAPTLSGGDDGGPVATSNSLTRPSVNGGRGLPGMRERAAAYGGTLEAGPLPDGGWRVRLELPA